jgi:hydrocephalus-inducing protein
MILTVRHSAVLCRQLKAKQQHTERLQVANWLPTPQRFAVIVERQSVAESTTITAPAYLDVPALSCKPCKLSIMPYLSLPIIARVKFVNETINEYSYYELDFTVEDSDRVETLMLSAAVRTVAKRSITITNPLDREITLKGTCSHKLVRFPAQVALPPHGSAPIDVSYMPLVATDASASLSFACAELGMYNYALQLAGQKAACDKRLVFNVALGRSETRTVTFRHFAPAPTVYAVKLSGAGAACFTAPATIAAATAPAGGADMELSVTFQPNNLGDAFQAVVEASSPEAGNYECNLVGRCLAPTPWGPIKASGGKPGGVPFMNPFVKDVEFRYCCDNTSFVVKPAEVLKARQQGNITVAYKEAPGKPKTAKLTVTCPSMTTCQWVFYLEA